jgi:4-hydroxy-tetrahydrodipicolinate synthase
MKDFALQPCFLSLILGLPPGQRVMIIPFILGRRVLPMPDFAGLMIPPLTPFTADGRLDEAWYVRELEWFAEKGVTRILVNGTTSEFFSLHPVERRLALRLARKHYSGTICYMCARNSLPETVEEARYGAEHGADAVATLPPFYYAGCPAEGVIRYLNAVAEATALPMLIYNFPKHTQNPMTPEILRAVKHAGMKDSSADLSLIPHTPKFMLGGDHKILEGFAQGVHGFVSASSNAAPALYVAMEKALKAGDNSRGAELQERIRERLAVFTGTMTIPRLKHALALHLPGYPTTIRAPLVNATPDCVAEVEKLGRD